MSRRIRQKLRTLLSEEKGAITKDPGGRLKICLVYPNTYFVGMSSLGFQSVYGLLNRRGDVLCERAFLPDPEEMDEYRRTGTPVLSVETQRPLGWFDIIAFSVSFENDYPNVLEILGLSGIPHKQSERTERQPLIVMGGVCAVSNPEPIADAMDIIFVGDAECIMDGFLDFALRAKGKKEQIEESLALKGIYVPSLYNVQYNADGTIKSRHASSGAKDIIDRACLKDLTESAGHSILTPNTEFSSMRLVEAMRGCPWKCGFCLTGHCLGPVRIKPLDSIKHEIETALEDTLRVGLIGPSLTDYPYIKQVLGIEGVEFSITSIRAGSKSMEMMGMLKSQKSVSIAAEAGSQRLRDFVNKKVSERDIHDTARAVLTSGSGRLRMYFMVGLPTETEDDINGIVDLVRKIRQDSPSGAITLTVSTFVPKPRTPFERMPMTDIKTIKQRLKAIKNPLMRLKGVRVFHDVPKYAFMQGLFSVGDRRVFGVIQNIAQGEGWLEACRNTSIDAGFYTMRVKPSDEIMPWDFIDASCRG